MNNLLQQPFIQVALPIVITLALGMFYQNKRLDDLNKRIDDLMAYMGTRFDEINKRLDRIELKLESHDRDIAALKERTGIVKI